MAGQTDRPTETPAQGMTPLTPSLGLTTKALGRGNSTLSQTNEEDWPPERLSLFLLFLGPVKEPRSVCVVTFKHGTSLVWSRTSVIPCMVMHVCNPVIPEAGALGSLGS